MKKVTKLFNADIKSIDEANRTIKFCFSDNLEDRSGEVVDQASWDIKNYLNNPQILFGHDPSTPENVLGQGIDLELNVNGKSYVTAQFDEAEINPRADMVFRQLVKRTLRAVSASFINHTYETDNDQPVLKDNELLEISIVPIPANPRAIALGLRDGSISTKDGKYLLDAMRNESELIEKQLQKSMPDGIKEKDVEELQTQITQLTGLITSVVDSVAALKDEVIALKPVEETEEEKTARLAQEAIDQKAEEDVAEAKRIADEEAAKGDEQINPALADEPDLDADLTDDQVAEALASLENQAA